jgi:hypothetical protein
MESRLVTTVSVWENGGNVELSSVLDWCLRQSADILMAVERPAEDRFGKYSFNATVGQKAKRLFAENLIQRLDARGWPGTELIRHTARIHVVRFDENLRNRMVETENELFRWTHHSPNRLPEDLCVFKKGQGYPLFASVTHDRDAYILSTGNAAPQGFERTDYTAKEMLLVWDGPYFCLID